MFFFGCQDNAATGSFWTTGIIWLVFIFITWTLKFGWAAVANKVSEKGAMRILFTTSCGNFFLEIGAIFEVSNIVNSDLTTAAIKRLLERLQSAESKGSAPQKRLAIGL